MQRTLSKYLVYYPSTALAGEWVGAHLATYRRNQYLPAEQLARLQRSRLAAILSHADANVVYYRGRLQHALVLLRSGADLAQVMDSIPLLTKQDLIDHRQQLLSMSRYWSAGKTTGGSTGEPVRLLKNPDALARERAATWRCYEWAGVGIGDRQARFWGVPHSRSGRLKAAFIDWLGNRLRISAFDLTSPTLSRYYHLLSNYQPDYLYGYVSVIELLARYMIETGLQPLSGLRCVITTSEVLSEASRELIQRAFGVRAYNEYGCGEVGSIAHECEQGGMHVMADNLLLELHGAGSQAGEIVVTDFHNRAMPLIRYRVGDFATMGDAHCACGRSLPLLKGVHGRSYDVITLADGRKLHPEAVMYVFEAIAQSTGAFRKFQAIQTAPDAFLVRIVPAGEWSMDLQSQVARALQDALATALRLTFEIVRDIPRERSGKMRVVKSQLTSAL